MRIDVVHSFDDSPCELFHLVGVFCHIALCRHKRSERHVSRLLADRGYDISLALALHSGRRRLKHSAVIACASLESRSDEIELHVEVESIVLAVHKPCFLYSIFQCHCRHAAFSSAYDVFAGQLTPREAVVGLPCHEERAVLFCQLRKYNGVVVSAFVGDVYCSFGTHKSYV